MKDKRVDKVNQHFDVFFNDRKFKIISCKIDDATGIISIKTKIFGQRFPHGGHFVLSIPSQNITRDVSIAFHAKAKDPAIENWEYTFKSE